MIWMLYFVDAAVMYSLYTPDNHEEENLVVQFVSQFSVLTGLQFPAFVLHYVGTLHSFLIFY